MSMYKIVMEGEAPRFALQDSSDPDHYSYGPHGIRFSKDYYNIEELGSGFIATPLDNPEISYTVSPVSLEDVDQAFPTTQRTFSSDEVFDEYLSKKFIGENSYAPFVPSPEEYSVVLSQKGVPQALVKEVGEDLFIRENNEWVEVLSEDDYPQVYGNIIRIEDDDVVSATKSWDKVLKSLKEAQEILKYVEA